MLHDAIRAAVFSSRLGRNYGLPALPRAALDARQIIEQPVSDELSQDLGRVFGALFAAGADADRVDPRLGRSIAEQVSGEPVGELLGVGQRWVSTTSTVSNSSPATSN